MELRGESWAVSHSGFRPWRGSDCHTCFNSSCRPLIQRQITSSWHTEGTSTTPAVPTSGSTAWSPNPQVSSCQTCSESSCTAGGALHSSCRTWGSCSAGGCSWDQPLKPLGLSFGPKNQQIKATVTDGEEFTCNGQGFRNSWIIYVVWQKKKKWHFSLCEDENIILCKSSLGTMSINLCMGEASMELPREPGLLG